MADNTTKKLDLVESPPATTRRQQLGGINAKISGIVAYRVPVDAVGLMG